MNDKICYLTAAETDLITIRKVVAEEKPDWSVTARNWMRMEEVEAFLRDRLQQFDTVCVRLLGGVDVMRGTINQLRSWSTDGEIELVLVSGGHQIDPELLELSSLQENRVRKIEKCLSRGGTRNIKQALEMALFTDEALQEPVDVKQYGMLNLPGCTDCEQPRGRVLLLTYRAFS
ncbi:MAG: hypothetical protein ABEK50_09775, partial [bacterium]